jgi:hypothetical protein
MSIFVPNVGEKEMLIDILISQAWRLGIYKAQMTPDGNTIFSTLTELDAEAGGYATKDLANEVVTDVLTADKWYVSTNSAGKAEAQYDAADTPQEWTFNAADVANANTAYGIFMWSLTLDFTSGGVTEFKVGDHVYGSTSAGDAIITDIRLTSGAWGDGDAVGTFCLKTQTGTFEAESINNIGASDVSDLGTITGDSAKKLILVEAFTAGQLIDTVGQKIKYTPKISLTSA